MNLREFTKPVTVKSLNDNLATMFGKNIDTQKFTLEQLQDTRNKLRTTLSQIETNESFDNVHTNESYQKNKMFLDVLNQAIEERNIQEAKKVDQDGDGKNDFDDVKIARMVASGMSKPEAIAKVKGKKKADESIVREGEEDKAELVMAAKDMVDRITAWMEDTAEMQTESMLELGDAIRDEMGQEQSQTFIDSVKPALEALYQSLETTRGTLTQGVTMLTGEEMPPTPMGDEEPGMEEPGMEEPGMEEPGMEPTVDDESAFSDDFAASEPAVGGAEESGRMKRESIQREIRKQKILEHQKLSLQLGRILSSKKN